MRKPAPTPRPWTGLIRRSWWALLVLVHVPALAGVGRAIAAGPGAGELLTALALALTVGLFGLKLLDVPFLRLRSRRGALGAFLLAFCLVHHEVAVSEAGREALAQTPAALVSGAVIEGLRRAAPALRRLRDALAAAPVRIGELAACGLAAVPAALPLPRAGLASCCSPRAPPA